MRLALGITICCAGILAVPVIADEPEKSFIGHLHNIKEIASTVPAVNKDVNPYGVAIVPRTTGNLVKDSILVSN
jgi:hypothetical protein